MTRPSAAAVRPASWAGRCIVLALAALLTTTGVLTTSAPSAAAATDLCAAPVVNVVACENTKTGTDAWQVTPDSSIEGFATQISTNVGGTVDFKVRTAATDYRVDIYRLGFYGGTGGRLVGSVKPTWKGTQPDCLRDAASGLVDCGNWNTSASWTVPSTAVSGVYTAVLQRLDSSAANQVTFVVRNEASRSDFVFQTSDTTWAAYNVWGGASLYNGNGPGPSGRAYKVSYNRPLASQELPGQVFWAEYPMIRFMEANGYDVSYIAGVDTDRNASLVRNHKTFLSVGHDEYWAGPQRTNVEAAKAAGVNLAFFSGNEMWWRIRWEGSIDGSGTDHRTVVCYKDSLTGAPADPTGDWTGTWRDPRFARPAGVVPENALIGQQFRVNGETSRADSLSVPAQFGKTRLWRNTAVANQAAGATYTFGAGTLGYEWDADTDNGYRPAGLAHLSETTVAVAQADVLQDDYGVNYKPGTVTHNLSLYRDATSGALVFGAGTVQWSWGLDDEHDGNHAVANVPMRQATVNLFADMGSQPATRQGDLVAATASTDTTPPSVQITSVPTSAAVGSSVTISGTAVDSGGGVVAGVEVSVDNGATWHPAAGLDSWSYTYTPTTSGAITVQARAVDDSARLSTPVSRSATVAARTCPCSIWGDSTPSTAPLTDAAALELGVKFRTTTAGYITAVRFYKATGNTGTHTGSLWTTDGRRLATGTFTGETASGWQTLTFATPVEVLANTPYVASYFSPTGTYSATPDTFTTRSVVNEPLVASAQATDGPNGVYLSGSSGFPTASYGAANYWVDVLFQSSPPPDSIAPTVAAASPLPGSSSVSRSTTVSAVFSESVQPGSIVMDVTGAGGSSIGGTVTYDVGTRTATFRPTEQLAPGTLLTARVTAAKDPSGNDLAAPLSWSFTTMQAPATAGVCPCGVWDDTAVPAVDTVSDAAAVELGMRFTASGDGTVTGVRFYKGSKNTGTHTGSLWSSDGRQLATATFTAESTSGWQTVSFSSPVAVTAGATYVVSYHTEVGYYSITAGGLASATTSGPLTALAGSSSGNGVYSYGASAYPSQTTQGSNYWVDVVYRPVVDTTPPGIARTSPGNGSTSIPVGAVPSAQFTEPVTGATLAVSSGGTPVAGVSSYQASTRTVSFTPDAALAAGTTFTATVSGAADTAGNPMGSPVSWSFTTAGAGACPCTMLADATPSTASTDDSGSVELGVRFSSDVDGFITGVRFYKGAGNTGTHTGSLWTEAGARLATGTFSGETSTGWQLLTFDQPVAITAGTAYIASYLAPNGHYAAQQDVFTAPLDNAPLHGAASTGSAGNGLFSYGTGGVVPSQSYRSTNYWVDAVFTTTAPADTVAPTVTSTSPVTGATGVGTGSPVLFTFSEPVSGAGATVAVTAGDSSTPIAGRVELRSPRVIAFVPSAALPSGTRVTATVSAVRDLAGNVMAGSSTTSFLTTTTTADACPCSLFPTSAEPTVLAATDTSATELGVRFSSDADGYVTGIRYYRGSANTGTHTGTLWSADGRLLATATFTAETTQGWQQVLFAQPVAVTAGTTYVASYHTNVGHYSYTADAFARSGVDRAPLHAPASTATQRTGLYAYGSGGFPSQGSDANYYVDVVFQQTASAGPPPVTQPADTTPPVVVSSTPAAGATAVAVSVVPTATFSETVAATSLEMTLTGPAGPVAAVTGLDSTGTTATLSPSAPLAGSTVYTVSVRATDGAGNAMPTAQTWSFTTQDTTPPTVVSRTPAAGATNVGVGSTVSSRFSEPVTPSSVSIAVTGPAGAVAGTTTTDSTGTVATWTPRTPLASSTGYSVTVGATDLAGNPLVPVTWTFTTADVTPPTVTSVTPAQGATAVATGAPIAVVFSEDVSPSSLTVTVVPASGAAAPTTQAYTQANRTLTLTPSALLAGSTVYRVTVTGAKDTSGNALAAPYSWTFTTAAASVFGASDVPPVASSTTTSGYEVGMRFQASANGWVTAVRFAKGTGATGVHTGSLWNAAGQRLATVQFTNETATGWQTAVLAQPVPVTANAVYTVSYTAPAGRFSSTPAYFGSAKVNGQLTAPANRTGSANGVYGQPGAAPTTSGSGANYWVDVVFTTSTPPGWSGTDRTAPTVTSYGPTGSGQARIGLAPTFTTSEPVTGATVTVTTGGTATSTTAAPTTAAPTTAAPTTAAPTTAAPTTAGPTTTSAAPATTTAAPTTAAPTTTAPATTTGTAVRGTLTYTSSTLTGRFAISDILRPRTTYTVTVSGGRDAAGNVMTPVSWTFTTM